MRREQISIVFTFLNNNYIRHVDVRLEAVMEFD